PSVAEPLWTFNMKEHQWSAKLQAPLGTGGTHFEKWKAPHESSVHEAIPSGRMGAGRADGARTAVPPRSMATAIGIVALADDQRRDWRRAAAQALAPVRRGRAFSSLMSLAAEQEAPSRWKGHVHLRSGKPLYILCLGDESS